jgi:DNA topoisomerase-3
MSQKQQTMKTIIAEKPSVAKEIAHIVGADKREEGYMQGNGYYVTWAFGHLVQPAMPETYGMKGFHAENLPVIPDPFVLVPRQVKTENGYKPDAGVLAQIKIIGKLFDSSERIIVATDAGREGELIFRYLYAYLGCRKPFDRLWISSLTDTAIREGLLNLRDGKEYDNLYHAAKARSEADWLVGINGTQALTIAAGRGTYSVGRQDRNLMCLEYRFQYLHTQRYRLHLIQYGGNSKGYERISLFHDLLFLDEALEWR